MRRWWGLTVAATLFLGGAGFGVELSTVVVPSEEEALEALQNGEITYEQYVLLLEVVAHGLDSTSLYLLDEFPNLIYVRPDTPELVDPTESVQLLTTVEPRGNGILAGRLRYRFYQRLDESERNWYRSSGNLALQDTYNFGFQLDRSESGRERWVRRSIGFSRGSGLLRRVTVGSFITRFGLGTVFGYPGKRLGYSSHLDDESLAYPDYGGYNGVLVETQYRRATMTGLYSITRGTDNRGTPFRLESLGTIVETTVGTFRPGLIFGVNRLVNRDSDHKSEVSMFGVVGEYRRRSGLVAVEVSHQNGDLVSATSSVIEGRKRFQSAELRFAGWSYSEDMIDLTAGSKSASLSRAETLEPIEYRDSFKRPGQSGMVVKSVVLLSSRVKLSSAILHASRGSSHRLQQFSSALSRELRRRNSLMITYLGSLRQTPDDTVQAARHQTRLEGRFRADRWSLRCYIGYETERDDRGHAVLFGYLRYDLEGDGLIELWSNFGDLGSIGLNYWYLFVRAEWPIIDKAGAAVKLSNRYNRDGSDKNLAQLSLELNVQL